MMNLTGKPLPWPPEAAKYSDDTACKFSAPGSNLVLDFHGNPATAGLAVFSDGNHHMALEAVVRAFLAANPKADYVIDAIVGDANGNFPPQIKFSEDGKWGHGPAGITEGPVQARVGRPLDVTAWAQDDGVGNAMMALFLGGGEGRVPPVNVKWFQHQGPGMVKFSEPVARVPSDGGTAETEVTFSAPGEYLLRASVYEPAGEATAGHSQCCWTNGFLKVNVTE